MTQLITPLLSFLLLYKYWALLALGFSAAVILPIPMNTVLLASGAFASQGYFNLYVSLAVSLAANIAGDCFGYSLARAYGRRALKMLRIRQPRSVQRFEGYIKGHPASTIFLTRFVGALGSLANLFAGFSGMSFGAFLLYDVLGNIVSIGGVVYAGYFLGIHWQDFTGFFGVIGWVVFGLFACTALILWYIRRGR